MSKQRGALILIILLLALVAGWWLLEQRGGLGSMEVSKIEKPLEIRHTAHLGMHTYTGSLELPSACSMLSAGLSIVGQSPAHITLVLTTSKDQECTHLPVPSPTPFDVTYSGTSSSTPVFDGVLINGAHASYSILEE